MNWPRPIPHFCFNSSLFLPPRIWPRFAGCGEGVFPEEAVQQVRTAPNAPMQCTTNPMTPRLSECAQTNRTSPNRSKHVETRLERRTRAHMCEQVHMSNGPSHSNKSLRFRGVPNRSKRRIGHKKPRRIQTNTPAPRVRKVQPHGTCRQQVERSRRSDVMALVANRSQGPKGTNSRHLSATGPKVQKVRRGGARSQQVPRVRKVQPDGTCRQQVQKSRGSN